MRSPRSMRRPLHSSLKSSGLGHIKDMVSIRERPASVEDRAVPGHWEGDLIAGTKNSHIVTLVERHSCYVMMMKVANRDTHSVVAALIKHAHKLPGELCKSLTWDRGKELSAHQRFTLATDVQVYFCDPRSPRQRGSNENTNRLLRQYLPKGTDLSVHSQAMPIPATKFGTNFSRLPIASCSRRIFLGLSRMACHSACLRLAPQQSLPSFANN